MKSVGFAFMAAAAACTPDASERYPIVPSSNVPAIGGWTEDMRPDAATDLDGRPGDDGGLLDGGTGPGDFLDGGPGELLDGGFFPIVDAGLDPFLDAGPGGVDQVPGNTDQIP
jgi:hypothetical protein